jgi:hypothetical protein
MQVSNIILIVAVEIYVALLVVTLILFIHTRKLKVLISRQQEKLLALLREPKKNKQPLSQIISSPTHTDPMPDTAPKPTSNAEQSYKNHLNDLLNATTVHYNLASADSDISSEQAKDSPLLQRILALRYAFLRAEELGTTEPMGSSEYWNIFQQALEPLLASDNNNQPELNNELDTCKKRIENLEKFKRLFFDMEKQWENAQANAENYHEQLIAMSDGLTNKEGFNDILQQYHSVYDDVHQTIVDTINEPDSNNSKSTLKIIRQDPRAAEEIVKLRNVAADQHRTINKLQQKLIEATTSIEKEVIFQELQQQLQRQIRFVQESETCIRLLEDELANAHEELSLQGKVLSEQSATHEENQQMKNTLHNFSLESKELISNIKTLEKENANLKKNQQLDKNAIPAPATPTSELTESKKIQSEYNDLKKQYAELEERYLDLKLSQ